MVEKTRTPEKPVKVDAQDARAARPGRPVLYVLIGAIVLVAIGLLVAFGTAT